MNTSTPRYVQLVTDDIGITDQLLSERLPTIKKRFLIAADLISSNKSDIPHIPSIPSTRCQGINQCIHLATGILFVGRPREKGLEQLLEELREESPFKTVDPSDVAVAAVLKYLLDYLTRISSTDEQLQQAIDIVAKAFRNINWYLDEDAIKGLGII